MHHRYTWEKYNDNGKLKQIFYITLLIVLILEINYQIIHGMYTRALGLQGN